MTQKQLYIGVMSGTSLDGIDIVISDFSTPASTSCQLIAAKIFPFPASLQERLHQIIITQQCDLTALCELDIELGQVIAQAIKQLLADYHIEASQIIAIGSHGQTLLHQPTGQYPFSLQIGNGNVIAEQTGITTIADFRQRDITAGGQGAPLVPAFHAECFAREQQDRIIINIGGIANLSLLPADKTQPILGFDSGPGNCLMDAWIQRHQQHAYDKNGQWAKSGQCHQGLLKQLLDEPYFQQDIPKSTGRELFNLNCLDEHLNHFEPTISPADVQATLLQLTANTIANAVQHYGNKYQAIFICGGGAHNVALMSQLQQQLPNKQVNTTETLGLHPDWVEACAFAGLAYLTLNNKAGNIPSVTGAKHPVVLGAIYPI